MTADENLLLRIVAMAIHSMLLTPSETRDRIEKLIIAVQPNNLDGTPKLRRGLPVVGGPHDGERHVALPGHTLLLLPLSQPVRGTYGELPETAESAAYILQTLTGDGLSVNFWRYCNLPCDAAVAQIVARYPASATAAGCA